MNFGFERIPFFYLHAFFPFIFFETILLSGKCIMLDESTDSYRCECDSDYEGPLCQTELESCGQDFCHNGGSCNALLNRCDCAPGWKGNYCQDRVTCSDRPCRNGGSCIPEPYGVSLSKSYFILHDNYTFLNKLLSIMIFIIHKI